ncbi:hypothetical protein GBA52_018063 [Prunus armeniaca]|nr:hypothetical protein GBA52_018063 [Prunus armeniaca]
MKEIKSGEEDLALKEMIIPIAKRSMRTSKGKDTRKGREDLRNKLGVKRSSRLVNLEEDRDITNIVCDYDFHVYACTMDVLEEFGC